MTRLPDLSPDHLDDRQLALHRAIAEGPRAQGPQAFALTDERGALRGPFGAFLLSPPSGEALQRLGAAIRFESDLSDRLREMAILLVAAAEDSGFEQMAHERVARAVGLVNAEIEALAQRRIPDLDDPRELLGLAVVRSLLTAADVPDELWDPAVASLGLRAVHELVVLVGYYRALALQLRVLRIGV